MRWLIIGIATSMFVSEASCFAADASPVLQANEVPIELAATGVSILPADKATVTLSLRKTGATNREARANVMAFADQLIAELISLGLPKQNIDFEEPTNRLGFVGNAAVSAAILEDIGHAAPPVKRPVSASASLELTILDLAMLPKIRGLIDEKDAVVMENPAFALTDERRARSAAINDAISKARADADSYAASLGMKVHRVVGAKDQAAQAIFPFPDYEKMFERFSGQPGVRNGMVKASARVTVQFALRPR